MKKMFTSLILAFGVLLSVNAKAQLEVSGPPDQKLFGTWTYTMQTNSLTLTTTIILSPTQQIFKVKGRQGLFKFFGCSAISDMIQIGSNAFITSPASGAAKDCEINSPGGISGYKVTENTLVLFDSYGRSQYDSNGNLVVFSRK